MGTILFQITHVFEFDLRLSLAAGLQNFVMVLNLPIPWTVLLN